MWLGLLALLVALPPGTAAAGSPATVLPTTAGPWVLTGWHTATAGHADQGVATVSAPGGGVRVVTRGNANVSARLRAAGWWHIGDPGSARGWLLDAYQGDRSMGAKLFVLTAPNGHRSLWRHRLNPGEKFNNSFAAVAPSGRWFLSGEWGTMHRLLVFRMPGANRAARAGHNLPMATTIHLTRPVRNVQGCSFATPTRLVCSTNDPGRALFGVPRQLIAVRLPHPVDGRPMIGRPELLGALPQVSICGSAETEGVDVHGDRMLVVAHEPGLCGGRVDLFTYRLRSAPGLDGAPGSPEPPLAADQGRHSRARPA